MSKTTSMLNLDLGHRCFSRRKISVLYKNPEEVLLGRKVHMYISKQ